MIDLYLRPYKNHDHDAYIAIYENSFPISERKPLEYMLASPQSHLYDLLTVALPSDEVVGLVILAYATYGQDTYALLDYLAISPKQRGSGLGHRVLPLVKEHCQRKGITPDLISKASEEKLNIFDLYKEMNIEEYLKPKIAKFSQELEKFRNHPNVGDIRQTGMICAIELVKNKETKEPFAYEDGIGKKIYLEGLKLGAILRPMWNCIYFITPYIITEKEIEKLTNIAYEALTKVLPNKE